MSAKKAIVRGSFVIAGALGMSASASALDYWVTTSGNLTGTSTVSGPTNASFNGLSLPCTASFTVSDTNGAGKVTAASFSGSTACSMITACNLPWPLGTLVSAGPPPVYDGKPLAASGVANNTRINGVCVKLPAPINQTCTGTVNGTLTNSPNTFTFTGTLTASPGPGTCTVNSRGSLTPSPALGIQ